MLLFKFQLQKGWRSNFRNQYLYMYFMQYIRYIYHIINIFGYFIFLQGIYDFFGKVYKPRRRIGATNRFPFLAILAKFLLVIWAWNWATKRYASPNINASYSKNQNINGPLIMVMNISDFDKNQWLIFQVIYWQYCE